MLSDLQKVFNMKKIMLAICFVAIHFFCAAQLPLIVNGHKFIAPPAGKDTIRINFSNTDLNVSTYNDLFGHPTSAVRSIADLLDYKGNATGIGITTIATGNWLAYSGQSSNDPCCTITGASFYGSSANNATVGGSNFYNYGTIQPARYDAAKPQLRLTGLNPASTYEIKITCIDGNLGFNNTAIFRVVGLTSPASQTIAGNVTSQSSGATFTLQPTAGGIIEIWINTDAASSADLAMVPALFITEQ